MRDNPSAVQITAQSKSAFRRAPCTALVLWVWGDCLSHYPVVSTHKNCAVRQVMGAKQAIGLRFSLSRRARHRSASSSAARLSRATPKLNSIWATRTRARRARLRGSFSARLSMATPRLNTIWATRTCARRARQRGSSGSRFLFDYVSAEGMAVRGKYAHNRNRTCPTCMAVNNATPVHIGEVRKFGDTAPRRGELILSDLCGHFQP